MAIGDLDGDGWPDIAVSNYGSGNVAVLKNKGDGTFNAQVTYPTDAQPWDLAIADLNGDGKSDLAVANDAAASSLAVFINNGDGTFAPRVSYPAGAHAHALAVGDLNGDGKPDVAVAAETDDAFSVYLNHGDGTFTRQPVVSAGWQPSGVGRAGRHRRRRQAGRHHRELDRDDLVRVPRQRRRRFRTRTSPRGLPRTGRTAPTGRWSVAAAWPRLRLDLAVATGNSYGTVLLNACAP